jgi:serine/threonine protein phosphatase PrpC
MRFESKSHAGSQYTTAEPEICEYEVSKDDIFLIISSDSVCDVMDTTKKPAHVVIASSCAMEEGKQKIDTDRFKWEARKLYEHARSCGSGDNFSVICVDLKSCGNLRVWCLVAITRNPFRIIKSTAHHSILFWKCVHPRRLLVPHKYTQLQYVILMFDTSFLHPL